MIRSTFGILTVAVVAVIAPALAHAGTVYGTQRQTGTIYRVDTTTGVTTVFGQTGVLGQGGSPNGNAWDPAGTRFYYAGAEANGSTEVFFSTGGNTKVKAGDVVGSVSNATIHNGQYFYIANDTDDLYRLPILGDGTFASPVFVDNITNNDPNIRFGDIVFDQNIIIGYGRDIAKNLGIFFRYDLGSQSLLTLIDDPQSDGTNSMYQLAWDGDDLIAHSTGNVEFYTMDILTGLLSPELSYTVSNPDTVLGTDGLTDLASFTTRGAVPTPSALLAGGAALAVLANRRRQRSSL